MEKLAISSKYPYLPLDTSVDTIRLLVLMPAPVNKESSNVDDRLHCQLIHSTFANPQDYIALSYSWGKDKRYGNETISLNGTDFEVRENLYLALYYLRSKTSIVIWVDAICIDQSNIEERNYQVSVMSLIYARAETVII
jgi:hypothetical protein